MVFNRCISWLGFGRSANVVGLHLGAEYVSIVALRPQQLELRAVARQIVFDAAVATDEGQLVESLSTDLRGIVEQLRLEPSSPTAATIDPLADALTLTDADTQPSIHAVRKRIHDRLIAVVTNAGLELSLMDPLPISLARLGRLGHGPDVAVRSPSRWTVVSNGNHTEAERSTRSRVSTLCMGPDLGSTRPLNSLRGITVPESLRSDVDPARDAPAVGAALALLGHAPLTSVRAVPTEHAKALGHMSS